MILAGESHSDRAPVSMVAWLLLFDDRNEMSQYKWLMQLIILVFYFSFCFIVNVSKISVLGIT